VSALLIGGGGPTGPVIIDGLLERGHHLTVVNRGTRAQHRPGDVEHVAADPHFAQSLADALVGRRYDVVVASYGRLRVMVPVLTEVTDRVVTIGGTAYADTGGRPADEDAPRRVDNKIVQRMVETEAVLDLAHAKGLFRHTHLRYPLLWGPGQIAPKEWSVVRRLLDSRPSVPVVAGGRTIESKCYVANAAAAVLRVLDMPEESSGRTYNVTDAENPDDLTRLQDLAAALGRPEPAVLDLPEAVTGPAGFWAVGRDLDYAREGRPPRSSHLVVDGGRIRRELGHVDIVDYAEAVARTAAHYMEHPLEPGGADEVKLGDPFDYPAEDAFAALLASFTSAVRAVPFAGTAFTHQYDHPKPEQGA
jgi:nucleoside-diphosphate-sugar epimerase